MKPMKMYQNHQKYKVFIGLEDSKRSWKLSILTQTERRQMAMVSDINKLLATLNNHYGSAKENVYIIYEAGPRGFTLCRQLRAAGFWCDVVPPHRVPQDKISKIKTDRRDAYILAELARSCPNSICEVVDEEREQDRLLSRVLEKLKVGTTALKNGVRARLYTLGIPFPFKTGIGWSSSLITYLKTVECSKSVRFWLDHELEKYELLTRQKKEYAKELKAISTAERYKDKVKILVSFPGIGWYTAIRILLEIGDCWERFSNEKQIASFLGLVCSEYSTGDTVRRGHITGMGNRVVRAWIVQCSWAAVRQDQHLKNKFERVTQNTGGSKKKAIVATARVMVVRMRACLISGEMYQRIPVAAAA